MAKDYEDGVGHALFLDNNDTLQKYRQRFYLKKDGIYMCGNSLGLASKDAEQSLLHVVEKWKNEGVQIWSVENSKYYLYSVNVAKIMAPLVGADEDEIAICGNTTGNIHQVISTFYQPTKERYKILVDDINFPTDRYAVDSQVRLKGLSPEQTVKVVKSKGKYMDEDAIIAAMTNDVALVFLPAVYYRTAQILDMRRVTNAAKEKGVLIGWDLCHGVGAIEINLKELDADFAVWCTYKYLNGGPGSAASLYINRRHFQKQPGLAGWFGNKNETQFQLKQEFDHKKDASGWQIGTPNIFSMATLEGALKIVKEAGVLNIRKKSLHITGYLMYLIEKKLKHYGFSIGNLREDSRRGGHVCLEHDEGYRISLALKSRGVVQDFRDPNVIRLTPTALYTSYEDIFKMVEILMDIMKKKYYEKFEKSRSFVV